VPEYIPRFLSICLAADKKQEQNTAKALADDLQRMIFKIFNNRGKGNTIR
jgi:hypothetical protein